jgi:hypothetical protein
VLHWLEIDLNCCTDLTLIDRSVASDQHLTDNQTVQKQTFPKSVGQPVAEVIYLAAQIFLTAEFMAAQSDFDNGNKEAFSVRFVFIFLMF